MTSEARLDAIMAVMEASFEPRWGEAWTRGQVAGSLTMPTTYIRLLDSNGEEPAAPDTTRAFAMVRAAPGEEELLLIATHPTCRGRGLARRLIDLLARDAARRGADQLFLEMRENNPARDLYLSRGFRQIGRRTNYYRTSDGTTIDALTYALDLRADG